MILSISSDAETDLAEGYWFYERQSPGSHVRCSKEVRTAKCDKTLPHFGDRIHVTRPEI
jgi:hypothetical protein